MENEEKKRSGCAIAFYIVLALVAGIIAGSFFCSWLVSLIF